MRLQLAYFPEIYDQELLYSVIARYSHHTGRPNKRFLLTELFDDRHVKAIFDLPTRLGILAERIATTRPLQAQDLIRRNTLYPYYAAFVPVERRKEAADGMIAAHPNVRALLNANLRYLDPVRHLRFCPDCLDEMKLRYGELYWRRDHQLPTVLVCPDHGGPLYNSTVQVGYNQTSYEPATQITSSNLARATVSCGSATGLNHLRRIALRSSRLLTEHVQGLGTTTPSEMYGPRLAQKGLIKQGGRLDRRAAIELVQRHFEDVAEAWPLLFGPGSRGVDWIVRMVRDAPIARHPVLHLLLEDMLESDIQAKVASPLSPVPTGEESLWPCRNPLADHFGDRVVGDLKPSARGTQTLVTATCTCGYIYTRSVDAAGHYCEPRLVRFGPTLRKTLRQAVVEGWTLARTAATVRIAYPTLRRQAKLHALTAEIQIIEKRSSDIRRKAASDRRVPDPRIKRRHWSVRVRDGELEMAKIDWPAIDHMWCDQLHIFAAAIRGRQPPIRVTVAALSREAGKPHYLGSHLSVLPKTRACAEGLVETWADFRERRMKDVCPTDDVLSRRRRPIKKEL